MNINVDIKMVLLFNPFCYNYKCQAPAENNIDILCAKTEMLQKYNDYWSLSLRTVL